MRIGSLFTGFGGLDQAVEEVFDARTVWTSDIDPGACKIIAHRYPDAPNLGDITTIDWSQVEPVDILTGGWPCQPFSLAGKRKGAADERALWPEVARAVRALRPRYIVLENVSAIASAGTGPELARATASLAELGYMGSWLRLRAADVGAPHGRARIFIFATDANSERVNRGGGTRDWRTEPADGDRRPVGLLPTPTARDHKGHNQRRDNTCLTGALLPTPTTQPTTGNGHARNLRTELLPTPRATDGTKGGPNQRGSSGDLMLPSAVTHLLPTPAAMNPNDGESFATWEERRQRTQERVHNGNGFGTPLSIAVQPESGKFGQYAEAIACWTPIVGRQAPDPTVNGRLNPRFVEWMQGCDDGWVCDVPNLSRAEQLKALGNGVVKQQAVAALTHMLALEVAA